MSACSFVDYEVALMLAKYGKRTLIDALAQKLQMTPDQLEVVLQSPPKKRAVSQVRKELSSADLVNELAHVHPKKGDMLRTLHQRFLNRTFLPNLRDVKRFLERHARPVGALKSRAESVDKVLRLLAELDVEELETLCQAQSEGGYSSLALISDAILHRDR
jgi:hypothetical protein